MMDQGLVADSSRLALVIPVLLLAALASAQDVDQFPPGFLFGMATSAHQVEGAWNTSGKGENIWDRLTHTRPGAVLDGSNGDVAADSYNNYVEDVRILKEMEMKVYRFSIAWSRVLPTGEGNQVSLPGVDYYNRLIDELISNDIIPLVTMYHWDLPQPLQDLGGWANEVIVDFFEDYARLLYSTYGDRVKWWVTINEPVEVCKGYSDSGPAPSLSLHGEGDYLCGHNVLKAHAKAYHLYDDEFRAAQQGNVSITLSSGWSEPLSNVSISDQEAATNSLQFSLGWFAHPVFSVEGDYPAVMKQRVAANSLAEGRPRSRLPEFDAFWVDYIKGTWDFFGLNHYTTDLATMGLTGEDPSRVRDSGVQSSQDPSWPSSASGWLKVVPWGFRKLLNWIADEYDNPLVFVTENGFSDRGELNDTNRSNYFISYLREMLKAVHLDGVNVIGYTAWTLVDDFEWLSGYTEKFGLYYVDFSDPARPRTAKDSSFVLAEIARTGRLPPETARPSKQDLLLHFTPEQD